MSESFILPEESSGDYDVYKLRNNCEDNECPSYYEEFIESDSDTSEPLDLYYNGEIVYKGSPELIVNENVIYKFNKTGQKLI